MLNRLYALTVLLGLSCASANGAAIVLDSFEIDEGHFSDALSFSGSTGGILGPTSTADREVAQVFFGAGSQRLFVDDDPATSVSGDSWRVRHLSARGVIANNVLLTTSGFVGYFLKTDTPNLVASLMIDDTATALERAEFQDIIPDGEWHLYEWELTDEFQWAPFALADANGIIDSPQVTIDSVYIVARPDGITLDQDATVFIDEVSANPDGRIPPIPEPSAALLFIVATVASGGISRRRLSLS